MQIYRKNVGFRGIQTRIVGEEGEHADHLTTTTALWSLFLPKYFDDSDDAWLVLRDKLLGKNAAGDLQITSKSAYDLFNGVHWDKKRLTLPFSIKWTQNLSQIRIFESSSRWIGILPNGTVPI